MATRQSLGAISPFFIVSDLSRAVAFYKDRLGFEVRFSEPTQEPFFAIVGRDGVQLLLKSVPAAVVRLPNHKHHEWALWDAFVYVDDPDALAAEFAYCGLSLRREVVNRDDGLRGFEVSDIDGYVLFFGRPN